MHNKLRHSYFNKHANVMNNINFTKYLWIHLQIENFDEKIAKIADNT